MVYRYTGTQVHRYTGIHINLSSLEFRMSQLFSSIKHKEYQKYRVKG